MFGQDYTADGPVDCGGNSTGVKPGQGSLKIDPDTVANLFRDWVMPLTKDIEVLYLLRRLEWDH